MLQTFEAVIDEQGNVRLLEPVQLPAGWRVLVIEAVVDILQTSLVP
jgi:hypothetical protein